MRYKLPTILLVSFLLFLLMTVTGCVETEHKVQSFLYDKQFTKQALVGKTIFIMPFHNTTDSKRISLEWKFYSMCRAKFYKSNWLTEKILEDILKEPLESIIAPEPRHLDLLINEFRETGTINQQDLAEIVLPADYILAISLEGKKLENDDYRFHGYLSLWHIKESREVYKCSYGETIFNKSYTGYANSFRDAKMIIYREIFLAALNSFPKD